MERTNTMRPSREPTGHFRNRHHAPDGILGSISIALNTQFSIATHIMATLGSAPGAEVNSALIAGSVNTSPSFVRRTLAKLSRAGLVDTATGKHGACPARS
jgi:hypothetical protein